MTLRNLNKEEIKILISQFDQLGEDDFNKKLTEIIDEKRNLTPNEINALKNIKVKNMSFSESYTDDKKNSLAYNLVDQSDATIQLAISNRISANNEWRGAKLKELLLAAKQQNPEQSVFDAIKADYYSPQKNNSIQAWIASFLHPEPEPGVIATLEQNIDALPLQLLVQRIAESIKSGRKFNADNKKDLNEINIWCVYFQKFCITVEQIKNDATSLEKNHKGFEKETDSIKNFSADIQKLLSAYSQGNMTSDKFKKQCTNVIKKMEDSAVMKYEHPLSSNLKTAILILKNL